MKFGEKHKFLLNFRNRFALRFHMFAILGCTACSGVLASKLLLLAGLNNIAIRYPLSVLLAYLVFFLCIKLWLGYVRPKRSHSGESHISDWIDLPDIPSSGGGRIFRYQPGGGHFGGAGASSTYDAHAPGIADHTGAMGDAASGAADGSGNILGEAAGSALDGEGGVAAIVVLAVLAALLATILGSTVYLIYEAPVILSEAAFEGFLAVSLIKGARTMDAGDWVGNIFSTTWKPFLITLIMALIAGVAIHHYFPGATRLIEVLKRG